MQPCLFGTTDGVVQWQMLNMAGELITHRLAETIGPGVGQILSPYWKFAASRGDGIVPIPHLMQLETFGNEVTLSTPLNQEYCFRIVTTRQDNDKLIRAHLVMNCKLLTKPPMKSTSLGTAEIWMALTRPFAPASQRKITKLPPSLSFLEEQPLKDTELGSKKIESFKCVGVGAEETSHHSISLAYHMDRSDLNRHINMHVYPQQALDYLSLCYSRVGGDVARLRFRAITAYFRRPFLPGDVANVEIDLVTSENQFRSALRFYHTKENILSKKISLGILARGVLASTR